jgi:hypothetical protein
MLTFTVAGVEERLLPMSVPPFVLPVDAPAPDDSLGSWRRNLTLAASLAQRAQQPALAQRLHQLAARAAP